MMSADMRTISGAVSPRRPLAGTLLLILLLAGPGATAQTTLPNRAASTAKAPSHAGIRLAVTVDDLPGAGPETGPFTYPSNVAGIIAALRAHGIQHATGFVIGSLLEGHPERQAAIDAWIEAGFEVGDHTYTHPSLATTDIATYLANIEANRPLIESLEKRTGQRSHYFRPPYLEEGATAGDRRALTEYLAARRYTMARASVDFGDWLYTDPYLRCFTQGNHHGLDLLRHRYAEDASATLAWAAVAAQQVAGRAITQVLLVHATIATSQMLDATLTAFDRAGAHYAPLTEALSYDVYHGQYDISGMNVLTQAGKRLRIPLPPAPPRPTAFLDQLCRR
jgi:peptidoglycan/xylan/chitin deacetylase (PgdA/CDA1 family)